MILEGKRCIAGEVNGGKWDKGSERNREEPKEEEWGKAMAEMFCYHPTFSNGFVLLPLKTIFFAIGLCLALLSGFDLSPTRRATTCSICHDRES